jgi:hypothetical protein
MARRFVEIDAVMDPQLHVIERVGKIEIHRRVVSRVAAEHDEQFDCAAAHFADQIAQRDAVSGQDQNWRARDRVIGVPECGVNLRDYRVQFWRLRFTCDYKALTAICLEITHDCCDPSFMFGACRSRDADAEFRSDPLTQWQNIARADRDPMIGVRSGNAGTRFRGVKTTHSCAVRLNYAAPVREIPRVSQRVRMRVKKIGIECDNDLCVRQIVGDLVIGDIVAAERVPDTPACRREALQNARQLSDQSGRTDWFCQNTKRSTAIGFQRFDCKIERVPKIVDCLDCAACGDCLRAVRIVEIENIGLPPDSSRAETRRMRRISLDLCRPPFITGHEQALSKSAVLCGSRKSQWLPRDHDLRLLNVGNDSFQWLFRAGTDSGERQRCARQSNKFAAAQAFRPIGSAGKKFVGFPLTVGTARRAARRARRSGPTIIGCVIHRWHVLQFVRRPLVST